MSTIAILSLLHESADHHSASRRFRNRPVLEWTLRRLASARLIDTTIVLCWDDQLQAVNLATGNQQAGVITKGPRFNLPEMTAITTARRWADGWRGGLLGSCEFDLGFHPTWVLEAIQLHDADAAVLIDPASALIDPVLLNTLVDHAQNEHDPELCFMQAAPGLAGTLLKRELVSRLATANIHPGRLLTYFPDQHGVDPTGRPGCAPVPTTVARSLHRFKIDSSRQLLRVQEAFAHLNGHLAETQAEELVAAMKNCPVNDRLPRDVTLEINTARGTAPIFAAGNQLAIHRPNMSVESAEAIFAELSRAEDLRLTLAGVGDPLLSPHCFDIIDAAASAGIEAIHLETDLLHSTPADLARLARTPVDVITVHFPAATASTYKAVMGVDGFAQVYANVAVLETEIKNAGRGVPLLALTFTKLRDNLAEMELWYDYWIRRLGHAVIVGPTDFAGQTKNRAVADMAPPNRVPCRRLSSRMTILSSGAVVACEQDVSGRHPLGQAGETPIEEIWQTRFAHLRESHRRCEFNSLCGNCREWHRA